MSLFGGTSSMQMFGNKMPQNLGNNSMGNSVFTPKKDNLGQGNSNSFNNETSGLPTNNNNNTSTNLFSSFNNTTSNSLFNKQGMNINTNTNTNTNTNNNTNTILNNLGNTSNSLFGGNLNSNQNNNLNNSNIISNQTNDNSLFGQVIDNKQSNPMLGEKEKSLFNQNLGSNTNTNSGSLFSNLNTNNLNNDNSNLTLSKNSNMSNSLFNKGTGGNNIFNNNNNNTNNTAEVKNNLFSGNNSGSLFNTNTNTNGVNNSIMSGGSIFNQGSNNITNNNSNLQNNNIKLVLDSSLIPKYMNKTDNTQISYLKSSGFVGNTVQIDSQLRQYWIEQIKIVIQSFEASLKSDSKMNVFHSYFYNRIPDLNIFNNTELNQDMKNYFNKLYNNIYCEYYIKSFNNPDQSFSPSPDNTCCMPYDLYLKAFNENPDKSKFYSFPITCPIQLNQRLKAVKCLVEDNLKEISEINKSKSDEIEETEKQVKNYLYEINLNKKKIDEKILRVNHKLIKLAEKFNRISINPNHDEEIKLKLSNIVDDFCNKKVNKRIELVRETLENIDSTKYNSLKINSDKNDLTNMFIENRAYEATSNKVFNHENYIKQIREMKMFADGLLSSMNSSLTDVSFIVKDYSKLKEKYGSGSGFGSQFGNGSS